jgi:hypothetical protein
MARLPVPTSWPLATRATLDINLTYALYNLHALKAKEGRKIKEGGKEGREEGRKGELYPRLRLFFPAFFRFPFDMQSSLLVLSYGPP